MMKEHSLVVLVAEDDYLVCEEIIRTLKKLGYEDIIEAADGKEAVDKACTMKPDIILMDIQMPELDGIEAAQQIRERQPTPVIILTAYETKEFIEKASGAGVAAYLTKPPKTGDLERAITIAIARHADLMELHQLNQKLEKALAEVKILRGILPICSHCKKIRDDKGYWQQIEAYIHDHSEADFSHSICPDCLQEHFPDFA